MTKLVVYSKDNCPACVLLKARLDKEGTEYVEVNVGKDMTVADFKEKFPNVRSLPHMENIKDSTW